MRPLIIANILGGFLLITACSTKSVDSLDDKRIENLKTIHSAMSSMLTADLYLEIRGDSPTIVEILGFLDDTGVSLFSILGHKAISEHYVIRHYDDDMISSAYVIEETFTIGGIKYVLTADGAITGMAEGVKNGGRGQVSRFNN